MIINLTMHPIHLYSPDTPDVATAEELADRLVATIPPDGRTARLTSKDLGQQFDVNVRGVRVPVHFAIFGELGGLPEDAPGVWWVVPLVSALAAPHRGDLLVPHRQVKNTEGTVVGCRALSRVVPCQLAAT